MENSKKESKEAKINWWDFWNSKVGLFILSVFFLTLIPFTYTNVQNYLHRKHDKEKLRTELSLEVGQRLKTITILKNDDLRMYEVNDMRLANYGVSDDLKPKYFNFKPPLTQYREQTLISLLIQLNNITEKKEREKTNKEIIVKIGFIKEYIDKLVLNPANRTQVTMSNGQTTLEYALQSEEKTQLQIDLLIPIQNWLVAWE